MYIEIKHMIESWLFLNLISNTVQYFLREIAKDCKLNPPLQYLVGYMMFYGGFRFVMGYPQIMQSLITMT
jgi:hypothetical protein